ncbi:MAG: bifunctional riboflavin kinase/FAD synthetase [Peptococcia bacterium]
MQIINNLDEIKRLNLPLAMALGNFDGVHKGHQVLLRSCVKESRDNAWISSVLLWRPHPVQVLQGEQQIKQLNTWSQKYKLIKSLGIQYLFCLPFNQQTAALSPLEFVQEYLVDLLQVKKIFIGFNYSFGQKGSGTSELLKNIGKEKGFAVSIIKPVTVGGEVVSSSLIREKYEEGDMSAATNLLGYYPSIEGQVVSGEHRGRELGYPTANLAVSSLQALPSFGVYVAYAKYDDLFWPAIVNIGRKPTFNGKKTTVEVHLINFSKNIYRKKLKISLLEKIRPEQKFSSKKELQAQIYRDLETAQQIFKKKTLI